MQVRTQAGIADGEAVLKVAVGAGLAFEKIVASNPSGRNEGIDVSEAMLERARRRLARSPGDNYRLAIGDAYDLDFADSEFDVLINNYMFDLLLTDLFDQLRQLRRPHLRYSSNSRCTNGGNARPCSALRASKSG